MATHDAPTHANGSWFGGPALTELSWPGDDTIPAASLRQGEHAAQAIEAPTFFRIYRAFLTARAALALTLLGILAGSVLLGNRPTWWMLGLTSLYAVATVTWWALPSQRRPAQSEQHTLRSTQSLLTVGVDLCAFALLHYLAGSNFNSQALLILPVLMAAVLMTRVLAMGVAAAATLNLLAVAWLQFTDVNGMPTLLITQAGLTGFGLFAIAILASELSVRLAREERVAKGSRELARQQAELNKLVIEQMSEGVLVIDRQGRVRTANPSARRLLAAYGQTTPPPFQLRGVPAWHPIVQAIERAASNPALSEEGLLADLRFDDATQRGLRLRVRFAMSQERQAQGEDVCVVFMEDLRTVQARLRQDKLAAMGRMSAGVAHEIRNPLAAISQANALLNEELATPTQLKLTQMIGDNANRLKRIVDDILAVAPGIRPPAPLMDAVEFVTQICREWSAAKGLPAPDAPDAPGATAASSLLALDLSGCENAPDHPHVRIRFEPDHLQRVLTNLLDNALRYQSGTPASILVSLHWTPHVHSPGLLMLSVSSDGEPISAETERALFEPFFSTSSRGTGLGLYICRELCERHSAHIDYRQHPIGVRHRNEFFVTFPVAHMEATPAHHP